MTVQLKGKRRQRVAAAVAERFVRDRMGIHALAQEFGRRPAVVRRLLDEAGIYVVDVPCIGVSDQEAAATLARRYSDGASITELVRVTGMDKRVIRGLLLQAGVTLPNRHPTTALDAQQILDGYRAGTSIRTLATRTGCSYGTVRAVLLANKVPLRPRGSGALVCAHGPAAEPTAADRAKIAAFAEFLRVTRTRSEMPRAGEPICTAAIGAAGYWSADRADGSSG